MKTLDDVRAKYPHLSVAIYAYEPNGPVTLECLTPAGESFKFTGATEATAIEAGFPEEDETPTTPTPPTATSVFD